VPRRLILAVLFTLALGGVAWAATGGAGGVQTYRGPGGERTGVRPTAVGLPKVGEKVTTGAAELPSALKAYHDSGRYAKDLAAVGRRAKQSLRRALRTGHSGCTTRYRRAWHSRLYRRARVCRKLTGKPAIVLDIDETSLSNYAGLVASGFTATGSAGVIVSGTGTAIGPTRSLYRFARNHKVGVFFVTGRPDSLRAVTVRNLKAAGYGQGWKDLAMKPTDEAVKAFKSGERAAIERKGYDIVVNVGDQESDLDGGHADARFKLANPFYFIPD
jgi:hypothetical protein